MDWAPNRCSCTAAGAGVALFAAADLNMGAVATVGAILRCPSCRSLYPDRIPAAAFAEQVYAGYYTDRPARGTGRLRRALRSLIDRSRRDYLSRGAPRAAQRLLDFGCGSGAYLDAMAVARPDLRLFGADVRPPAASARFQRLAPDDLEQGGPYDWITLGHVVEHHPDPRILLTRLAALLTPGGGIWIATPNADSVLIDAAGRWARDIDFPRHREIFSPAGLAELVTAAGLQPVFLSPPRINAALNALACLRNILRDRRGRPGSRAAAFAATLVSVARHSLTAASARDARSPELVIVARKPGDDRHHGA